MEAFATERLIDIAKGDLSSRGYKVVAASGPDAEAAWVLCQGPGDEDGTASTLVIPKWDCLKGSHLLDSETVAKAGREALAYGQAMTAQAMTVRVCPDGVKTVLHRTPQPGSPEELAAAHREKWHDSDLRKRMMQVAGMLLERRAGTLARVDDISEMYDYAIADGARLTLLSVSSVASGGQEPVDWVAAQPGALQEALLTALALQRTGVCPPSVREVAVGGVLFIVPESSAHACVRTSFELNMFGMPAVSECA